MSAKNPIIAVTGSSGAGTTTTGRAMQRIFQDLGLKAALVSGDSFHRFTRRQMAALAAEGKYGENNHFSLEANHMDRLEALFREYARDGRGQYRHYVHDDDAELIATGAMPGTFTEWRDLPEGTDLLFYEGLHGGVVTERFNIAQYVDLLIGMTPIINLEWIQKIYRDTRYRGYSPEAVVHTILGRMEDYVRCILPQFSHTHVNFQRVPTVDTSNPFMAREIPGLDESFVVIHFHKNRHADMPALLERIEGSFLSRPDTLVVPGAQLDLAFQLIVSPWVRELMERRAEARRGTGFPPSRE